MRTLEFIVKANKGVLGNKTRRKISTGTSTGVHGIGFVMLLILVIAIPSKIAAADLWNAGFIYDRFDLTLDSGERTEILGPLFYHQLRDSGETVAMPPLFSHLQDEATDSEEFDMLYPLLTYDRYGAEHRLQFFQLLSFAGGESQDEIPRRRLTLFPIYFQQRSPDPALNYTALLPIYGHLKNRLFRSEIDFVLMPIYVKTVKRSSADFATDDSLLDLTGRFVSARHGEVTTYNYLFPFFHLRYGDGLRGWQFWPLVGHEHKEITTRTNMWGDPEPVPGHDKRFVLWPFFADQSRDIGSENPEHQQFLIPFYNYLRSPLRDSTSYLWPLGLTITDDRGKKYHEVGAPWPFIVFARGEGKTVNRVWPLFSRGHNESIESNSYLWPLYKYNRIHSGALDRDRTRILLFLFSDVNERNIETGKARERTDFWPLFAWRRDFNGEQRLQILALLEPILPTNKSIERNWSPLWSLWRAQKNPETGASSQSFLWNLYRREATATTKKCSLLFGLFQYQSDSDARRYRLLYIPFGGKKDRTDNDSAPIER